MTPVEGSWDEVPLVGRQRELAVLRAAVTRADDGRPGGVLVAGDAGGGKSRLVRALLEDGPRALVLRVHCVDLGEPGLPYLALVDLVRALRAAAADDPGLASVLDRFPTVTELTGRGGSGETAVDESRRLQLFDATAALLAEVAALRGPVVLVLEDLQWLDASSGDFLRFLLSRAVDERLVVVATVRTDGLTARPRVRRLVAELGRLPAVHRLDLEPFDAAEVAEYLSHVPDAVSDPEVAAEVFRRTAGNPFFVETLAHTRAGSDGIPPALTDLLVGRMDGLSEDARTVVQSAAVVSHTVPDRQLRQVVGLADDVVDQALRAVVGEGLLVTDGDGYAFAHDLLRTAVYDDLLPGVRARLHAAHAAVLEAGCVGPVRPAEIAHHYTHADDAPRALVWSARAAEEAERVLAPDEALEHLERVLALDPDGPVAIRAARAAGLAGEPARAIELARRAVELCDADGDPTGGIEARAELVRQLLVTDATGPAVRPAEEAARLATSDGVEPGTAALAHVVLARALVADRRTDGVRAHAERALTEAHAAGVPALEVEALTSTSLLDEVEGDREAAAARLGSALALARAEGELAAELRAHYALASLHYYNGDVGGSLPVLRTAMARVSESGLRWSSAGVELRVLQAIALYVTGDLAGSLEVAESSGSRPPDVAAARLAAVGCYAAVARGFADADRRFEALRDSWDADPQVGLVAGGCEADRLAWEGDAEAAVAMAERTQVHLDTVAGEGMYGGLWLSSLGLSALADRAASCRQRRDEAGATEALRQGGVLLGRVERLASGGRGRPGDLGPEGRAWHARALAEHARLAGEPAVEAWQRALDSFGYGHVYEQARCQWRLAEALVAAGDRATARTHATAAAEAAERMRAVPLQQAVAATVSRARLAGSAATADAVLTGREREVLALVAEGLTNREVGRRLFISEKTASVHLSNLMAKLNVSSRTEAVTVAQRRGLLDVM